MRQLLHKLLTSTRALALVTIIVSVCQQVLAQTDPNLSYSASEATAVIDAGGVTVTAPALSNPLGVDVTYSSSNTAVASVNSSGNITVIDAGQTTISARATDADTYLQTPASYVLTVKRDISGAVITLAETSFTYDGTAKTPAVSSVTLGGQALDEAYYSVSYSNNVDAAAADAASAPTVTVTGSGIYIGSISTTFSISKGTAGLAFPQDAASMTLGEEWTQPVLSNPHQLTVSYSSSDTGVATVDASGQVSAQAAGTTTISAAFAGNGNYEAQTVSYTLTVIQPDPPVTPDPPTPDPPQPIVKGPAELVFSASVAEGLVGDPFTPPTLSNPHDLPVSYSSSAPGVATVDANGAVTLLNFGETTVSAAFAGNDYYEPQTVSYRLAVKVGFGVWVGDTQVTTTNFDDVLGDNRFFFAVDEGMLVISHNRNPVTVRTTLRDLTVFINGENRLERIVYDGGLERNARLHMTSYADVPGKLTLSTSDGVISGFASIALDSDALTFLLDPEGGTCQGGRLLTAGGSVAKTAVIGQYIKPVTHGTAVGFPSETYSGLDLTNTVVDNTLFTLVQHPGESDEDDDYYDPVDSCIVLNHPRSAAEIRSMAEAVERGELLPGRGDYASLFQGGITFMVPSGEGEIELGVQTETGYGLMCQMGTGEPQEIVRNERGMATIGYQTDKPTYVYIFLSQTGGARGTRIGKREKSRGTIYKYKVTLKVVGKNPLDDISGFPKWMKPRVEIDRGTTAIGDIGLQPSPAVQEQDDYWYDLQGRRIGRPAKPGLYIHHRKKVVVR